MIPSIRPITVPLNGVWSSESSVVLQCAADAIEAWLARDCDVCRSNTDHVLHTTPNLFKLSLLRLPSVRAENDAEPA